MPETLTRAVRGEPALARRPRLIAVGVRDVEHDASTLAWAMDDAVPGVDRLHVVHAYVPLRIEGCAWPPVSAARDARRESAQRILARALQCLRKTHTSHDIDGSVVGGVADDVLIEFSEVVDLEVVGEDETRRSRPRTTTRRTLQFARCPVVIVPADYGAELVDPLLPVTVMIDSLDLPAAVIEYGLREAARRRTTLRVAQVWSALHEEGPWTAELMASRQGQLDAQLSDWDHPSVGIIAELLIDDGPDTLLDLRIDSQLLVVSATAVRLLGPADPSVLHRCPAVVVPVAGRT